MHLEQSFPSGFNRGEPGGERRRPDASIFPRGRDSESPWPENCRCDCVRAGGEMHSGNKRPSEKQLPPSAALRPRQQLSKPQFV